MVCNINETNLKHNASIECTGLQAVLKRNFGKTTPRKECDL
jgi:hypothetical protein